MPHLPSPPWNPAPPFEIPWLPRAIRCMIGNAMSGVQQERESLAEADRHIAEDEERLAVQLRLMEWMIQGGHNTAFAEECLLRLRQDLGHWRACRQLIVNAIARR